MERWGRTAPSRACSSCCISPTHYGQEIDYDELVKTIGIPCVVKPATEGSALGVEIVESAEDLPAAIDRVFAIDKLALIESFVEGTEVTAAVLGNDDPRVLPVIKIVPKKGEFYDFESKYAPGGSEHICPAPIDPDITAKIQEYAIVAHKVLGCRGVSRSDFIIDKDGVPWILETNTIPGMTATSLLPDAARYILTINNGGWGSCSPLFLVWKWGIRSRFA